MPSDPALLRSSFPQLLLNFSEAGAVQLMLLGVRDSNAVGCMANGVKSTNAASTSERTLIGAVFCIAADMSGLDFEAKRKAAQERLKAEDEEKRNTQQSARCIN
jgi:hypothetical protein